MKNFLLVGSFFLFFSCNEPKRFERLSGDDTRIEFINAIVENDSFNILHDEYMYNGGGVGAGDLDNDGLPDLIFTGNKVSTKVYLNAGDFEFTDITHRFEHLSDDQWYSGVSLGDINSDGWLDVYLTSTSSKDPRKRKNRLWINQGKNDGQISFKEMGEQFGIADDGYSVHAGFIDYDLDGDLDLYVLNNIVNKSIPTNYRPKITDGSAINNDKLYRNEGNGKFTDVTKEAGIVYEGYGLGLAFGDINKDGYPDIYVSNDYISNDILYLNQQDGTFENVTRQYLSYQSRFSMGNEMVDINNDGLLDIMSVDMMPEEYPRKKQTINGNSYVVYINNEKYNYEPQYVRNMVHLHNGFVNGEMVPFSEVGQMLGIFQTEWSWSPLFADYDNDGDRDLMMTNGFPKDLTDKDFTNYKAQVHGFLASDRQVIDRIPIVKVTNYAFENTGPYTFTDKTEEWGMKLPSFSNGAAFVDLDNDGDLDYVVNNIDEPAYIYRNNTIGKLGEKKNFVKLRLKGKEKNTFAIGAKIELWSGDQYQYAENFLTRGYISSVDPVIHFGLGNNGTIDSIRITWPDHKKQTVLSNPEVNRLLVADESDAIARIRPFIRPSEKTLLFEKSRDVLTYKHAEQDYIDFFQNQRIIQHKLSQIAPCMASGDLNGDGSEDLVIGGSKDNPTAVFLRKGKTFENKKIEGLTDIKKCTESDMIIADIDGDKDNDIVAISGGYDNETESEYDHSLYLNNNGVFARSVLPIPAFPASVVRPFDFDHDGDLDLFIGARVKRNSYPFSSESYILINEGGRFMERKFSFNAGMVTDAVWSDYNSDGWEDIILAREWNSIRILRNETGKNFVMETAPLDANHGLWSAVAAGDLDDDGDDDYIVGNLGDNHRFTVSNEYQLRLYAVDIDNNGSIDPVATSYWKDQQGVMKEYPVNYLDELAAQSPFFRKKFTSYTKFSVTTADSIISRKLVTNENTFHVNTTSSYILWNNNGHFKWEKLPQAAQTSPIKKILIRDLNDDGKKDILLAGNDHSYDVSTGYYDASRGIVLLGQGDKKFEVTPPSKSGLVLRGQVTSLLLFEGPDPILIAGVNRDSVIVHKVRVNKKEDLAASDN